MTAARTLRLRTGDGIPYSLLAGYPKIVAEDRFTTTAQEQYLMRTTDAQEFYKECFPPPRVVSHSPSLGYLVLIGCGGHAVEFPARRRMPGTGFLITKKVTFEGFTGAMAWDPLNEDAANEDKYEQYCRVTIDYEMMLESDDNPRDVEKPITFLERSTSTGGEFLTINPKKTEIADAAIGTDAAQAQTIKKSKDSLHPIIKVVPTVEWNCVWDYAVSPCWGILIDQLGTVNDGDFSFPWLGDPEAETVMFVGYTAEQQYFWSGKAGGAVEVWDEANVEVWRMNMKFSQRRIYDTDTGNIYGWNHVWIPNEQKFMKIAMGTARNDLYEARDFNALFATALTTPPT